MTPDISEAQQQRNDGIIVLALTCLTLLCQGSPEFYHLAYEQVPKRNLVMIWQEELNPDRNGGHNAFTIEGSRYFTKRAIASILREPAVYLCYCLQKTVFFWLGNPISE
jgi:hypothetical protein